MTTIITNSTFKKKNAKFEFYEIFFFFESEKCLIYIIIKKKKCEKRYEI